MRKRSLLPRMSLGLELDFSFSYKKKESEKLRVVFDGSLINIGSGFNFSSKSLFLLSEAIYASKLSSLCSSSLSVEFFDYKLRLGVVDFFPIFFSICSCKYRESLSCKSKY